MFVNVFNNVFITGRVLSSKAVEECKKIKLVKDVTNIPKPIKLAAQPSEKSTGWFT